MARDAVPVLEAVIDPRTTKQTAAVADRLRAVLFLKRAGPSRPGSKGFDVESRSAVSQREPGTVEARRRTRNRRPHRAAARTDRFDPTRRRRKPHRDPGQAPMCRKSGLSETLRVESKAMRVAPRDTSSLPSDGEMKMRMRIQIHLHHSAFMFPPTGTAQVSIGGAPCRHTIVPIARTGGQNDHALWLGSSHPQSWRRAISAAARS